MALLFVAMVGCGGGTEPATDRPETRDASASVQAFAGSEASAAISPIPIAPGALRQVYVLPSSPAANDSNVGSFDAPLKTISKAIANLRIGDDVVIGPGVYRESIELPAMAAGAATYIRALTRYSAIIKGSDLTGGWLPVSADIWARDWAGSEPEQIFRAGAPLSQIAGTVFGGYPLDPTNPLNSVHPPIGIWPGRVPGDETTLKPDSFYFKAAAKKLYVRLSKPLSLGEELEVSSRTYVLRSLEANNLVIDGFVFEHANTSLTQRHGAIYLKGQGITIRNSTIRHMDAVCVMLYGDQLKLLNSSLSACGQLAISGSGTRITISGNRLTANHTRGFDLNWEAGGMKFTGTPAFADSTISSNTVVSTNGDAIWFDWTPRNIVIDGNTLAYNTGHGIHFEASKGATISNNTSYGNGKRGIYLLDSNGVSISRNIAFANTLQGISIAASTRVIDYPDMAPIDNSVTANTVAWNDARGSRLQFNLAEIVYANRSDRNVSHATDVVPRYSAGWPSTANPYLSGLPSWRAFSGQDSNSIESWGAMPPTLASALAAKKLLTPADLPAMLQTAGVP